MSGVCLLFLEFTVVPSLFVDLSISLKKSHWNNSFAVQFQDHPTHLSHKSLTINKTYSILHCGLKKNVDIKQLQTTHKFINKNGYFTFFQYTWVSRITPLTASRNVSFSTNKQTNDAVVLLLWSFSLSHAACCEMNKYHSEQSSHVLYIQPARANTTAYARVRRRRLCL